jgi:hypothetical protein
MREEFTGNETEDEFDPEDPLNPVFLLWCFYTWKPSSSPIT